jgi:hypothetical protein
MFWWLTAPLFLTCFFGFTHSVPYSLIIWFWNVFLFQITRWFWHFRLPVSRFQDLMVVVLIDGTFFVSWALICSVQRFQSLNRLICRDRVSRLNITCSQRTLQFGFHIQLNICRNGSERIFSIRNISDNDWSNSTNWWFHSDSQTAFTAKGSAAVGGFAAPDYLFTDSSIWTGWLHLYLTFRSGSWATLRTVSTVYASSRFHCASSQGWRLGASPPKSREQGRALLLLLIAPFASN